MGSDVCGAGTSCFVDAGCEGQCKSLIQTISSQAVCHTRHKVGLFPFLQVVSPPSFGWLPGNEKTPLKGVVTCCVPGEGEALLRLFPGVFVPHTPTLPSRSSRHMNCVYFHNDVCHIWLCYNVHKYGHINLRLIRIGYIAISPYQRLSRFGRGRRLLILRQVQDKP